MTTRTVVATDEERPPPPPARPVPRWLFTFTIFTGSFLLFQVQPMVARLALPDLGGAPAVWNSAMLVYQALLLGGYAWAHWLQRFPTRRQVVLHLALLGAACLWLPVGLASLEPPTGAAVVLFVPVLLLVSVGPVILAVSAQAPMMQGWFAAGHGQNPYPLYAASNLGSFAGLIAYPLVVEPTMRLGPQRWAWTVGYVALVLLVLACGLASARAAAGGGATAVPSTTATPVPRRRRLLWIALSAVPSGLMLSTTTLLSTDIMAMPLLWAIPLGLYLLSFTVAFAERRSAARLGTRAAPVLLLLVGATALLGGGLTGYPVAALMLLALFAVAVALHGRLYDTRPAPERLTSFYLTTAVGGALGGLLCGLIAPVAFDWVYEHPLLILGAAALVPLHPAGRRLPAVRPLYVLTILGLMLGLGAGTTIPPSFDGSRDRSYFGVYTVRDSADGERRTLVHGVTVHGAELRDPDRRNEPTMYYGPGSGASLVLSSSEELFGSEASIGVVGLGAGTLACFAQPRQAWQFFEIDPLIVHIARDSGQFHFLGDCAPDARITVGDARLELGKIADDAYDVLAVDAFSSDAIPMHLMTREAFDAFDRVVREDGLLLVHITNKFIDLEPVLGALTRDAGWDAAVRKDAPREPGLTDSSWVAMSRTPGLLDELLAAAGGEWQPLADAGGQRLWTDDYASVLPLLK